MSATPSTTWSGRPRAGRSRGDAPRARASTIPPIRAVPALPRQRAVRRSRRVLSLWRAGRPSCCWSGCRRRSSSASAPCCSRRCSAFRSACGPRCIARSVVDASPADCSRSSASRCRPSSIGIVLILIFSVWLGWLPSFGRGDDGGDLGGWTTGLLTVERPQGADPAEPDARPVPDDADHAAGARRDAARCCAPTSSSSRARAACRAAPSITAMRSAIRCVPVITIIGLQFGNIFAFSIIVETVFQWPGLGLLVIQSIQFADVPLLAAYLVMIALGFRAASISRSICSTRRSIRACAPACVRRGRAHEHGCRRAGAQRWWDSDLAYDFRRSPFAISPPSSTIVLIAVAAIGRRLSSRRSTPSIRRAPMSSMRACRRAPRACSAATYLLGTDPQGRDMLSAMMYGLRTSLLVGVGSVAARGARRHLARPAQRLFRRLARRRDHAHRRRSAQLPGDPDRAADRWRHPHRYGPGHHDALAIPVLVIAIAASLLGAVRPHGPRAGAGRARQGICARRPDDRRRPAAHRAHAHPARTCSGRCWSSPRSISRSPSWPRRRCRFLGVGVPPTQPSLGTLVRIGNEFLFSGDWWISMFPGGLLVLLSLAINLLGDWLRDALNPRLSNG